VFSRLRRALAPPALSGWAGLCLVQVLSGASMPRLQLVESRGEPLGASSNRAVRSLTFRHSVFCLGGPATSSLSCLHPLFSEIFRLMFARDLGSGIKHASARSEYACHSTPRASGSSAACLAHSSVFSLPATPLCAGRHLISMTIPEMALRNVAMCFRAWSAPPQLTWHQYPKSRVPLRFFFV